MTSSKTNIAIKLVAFATTCVHAFAGILTCLAPLWAIMGLTHGLILIVLGDRLGGLNFISLVLAIGFANLALISSTHEKLRQAITTANHEERPTETLFGYILGLTEYIETYRAVTHGNKYDETLTNNARAYLLKLGRPSRL